jgi:hypothetical protein
MCVAAACPVNLTRCSWNVSIWQFPEAVAMYFLLLLQRLLSIGVCPFCLVGTGRLGMNNLNSLRGDEPS